MDNNISINTKTREVFPDYEIIGIEGENNYEYLVFDLDNYIEGRPRLEVVQGTSKHFIEYSNFIIEDDKYRLQVKNSLLTNPSLSIQFCLYNSNDELTFKSLPKSFNVPESINATTEIPDEYETWYENASAKLNEMDIALAKVDNLDIDADKVEHTATVTITNKNGERKIVAIYDGEQGETGNGIVNTEKTSTSGLVDTYTINYDNGNTNTFDVTNGKDGDDYVITPQDYSAIAGIVETDMAPTISAIEGTANQANNTANTAKSIAEGANQALGYSNYQTMITAFNALDDDVYRVGQNIYIQTREVPDLWVYSVESTSVSYQYTTDEAFITGLETDGYVQVGYYKLSMLETQKVDLTDYVRNTDYATTTTGGVIKTSGIYATAMGSGGELTAQTKQYSSYDTMSNSAFISKGTLENAITGKSLVSSTDYATTSTGGVVIPYTTYGTTIITAEGATKGRLATYPASSTEIDNRTPSNTPHTQINANNCKPIVPAMLDYAIEKGLGDNKNTWTSTEKSNARSTIGAVGFTDYGTSQDAGVVKSGSGFLINSSGVPSASNWSYSTYQGNSSSVFIGKGTLEAVFAGKKFAPMQTLTQVEYDALISGGTVDSNTYYFIEEE